MGKIIQGNYEVFTQKEDAIRKFRKLQVGCREKLSEGQSIEFRCSKKGKIIITNPPTRHVQNTNSTELFAEVIEEDGKTYVTYYTKFSKANNVFKLILLSGDLILVILAIIFSIMSVNKEPAFVILILGLLFFTFRLITGIKEDRNSPKDSDIMIKELEKRVEAVNLWDK